MNPDKYFHDIVDAFVGGGRVPFGLNPDDFDNILPISAPAFAQIMEVIESVHTIRGTTAPIFYQYFKTDETEKVSMSGYTVEQMTTSISQSPLNVFHLYVRDLQNAIESVVGAADYNDDMTDYFRRCFDYRWRLSGISADKRIQDGIEIRTETGTATINAYTRVSSGQWPFTIAEIKSMVSYQRTGSLSNTSVLGPIWILQSLLYSSPQTEVFYTDQDRTTMATRVRGGQGLADESFWYNNNTIVRSFFPAGQWGNWSVIDGSWESINGVVTIDTSVYSTFPFDRDEASYAGFWSVAQSGGSLTGSLDFRREAVAVWARTSAADEFVAVASSNGTNVLSHGVGDGSPLYGILRYGPGSRLEFTLGGTGEPVCSFSTSNINEFNSTDGPYSTEYTEVATPTISIGLNSIDVWAQETIASNFNGQDALNGGQLKYLAIGTVSDSEESFQKDYVSSDIIVDPLDSSVGESSDGYLKLINTLGITSAGPTELWLTNFVDVWVANAQTDVVGLQTTVTDLRLTYPTILTTTDV